jgi:STIP1 homology and U-box containing protein 1
MSLEVPDHLVCRITDEMMKDPVILESGFTYEREQIQLHFKMNGNFDPLTREEVNPEVLIVNKNIKQAAQEYLEKNPWAFEHIPGQTLESLKL